MEVHCRIFGLPLQGADDEDMQTFWNSVAKHCTVLSCYRKIFVMSPEALYVISVGSETANISTWSSNILLESLLPKGIVYFCLREGVEIFWPNGNIIIQDCWEAIYRGLIWYLSARWSTWWRWKIIKLIEKRDKSSIVNLDRQGSKTKRGLLQIFQTFGGRPFPGEWWIKHWLGNHSEPKRLLIFFF